MTSPTPDDLDALAKGLTKAQVSDAEIDALVAKGWDWHSAYRHLQTAAHSRAHLEKNDG